MFIQDIVEYIDVEVASCPCNRGLNILIQDIVECIEVEGTSCPGNRGIKYVNDTRTKYRVGYHSLYSPRFIRKQSLGS
jgi:hypothetical protein